MPRLPIWIRTALLVIAASPLCWGQRRAAPQPLVPANFNSFNDNLGYRWDINSYGSLNSATNSCLRSSPYLTINGSQFSSSRSMMTQDGQEYVLQNTYNNTEVTRRIYIDRVRGVARYAESFRNLTKHVQKLNVVLTIRLGTRVNQHFTNKGKPFVSSLGKDAFGFASLGQGSMPAVLFVVADPRSKVKPKIQSQSGRGFSFTYALSVKPLATVSLFHKLAQRRNLTAANVSKEFKSISKSRPDDKRLTRDIKKTIVNFNLGGIDFELGKEIQAVQDMADALDVDRGKEDIVVMNDEARISGKISGPDLTVKTAFGESTFPLPEVALLMGGGEAAGLRDVYLRNGEILRGVVSKPGFTLTTKAGHKLDIDLPRVRAIVLHADPKDGKPPEGVACYIHCLSGDRLALKPDVLKLRVATAWGYFDLPASKIAALKQIREPVPGHRIYLKNKSRFTGIVHGGKLRAESHRYGAIEVEPYTLKNLKSINARFDDDDEITAAHCELTGENILVGEIAAKELHVGFSIGVTPVKPLEISVMEINSESDDGQRLNYDFKLAGKGEFTGHLVEDVIPFEIGEISLRIPRNHFVRYKSHVLKKAKEQPAKDTDKEAPKAAPEDLIPK
ncbi:MAG: hypothetical protein QF473_01155 [Planctomycetota bacterium]|nr:hypothetical protein [Planctomycetota bacterium]